MTETAAIEVAAGLIFRDGKLLIAQRYPEAHLGGLWEFPGGKREPGESFEQAALIEAARLRLPLPLGGLRARRSLLALDNLVDHTHGHPFYDNHETIYTIAGQPLADLNAGIGRYVASLLPGLAALDAS